MNIEFFKWDDDEDDFISLEEIEFTKEKFKDVIQTEIRPWNDIVYYSERFMVFYSYWKDDIYMFLISQ